MNSLRGKSISSSIVSGTLLVSSLGWVTLAYGQTPPPAKAVATPSVPPAAADKPDPPVQPAKASDNIPDITLDPASLVPDLPPIPSGAKATLVGGEIEHIDPVEDEITIRIFGGGKMRARFDPRTNISRDGKPVPTEELKAGQRIYADTILLNGVVFARNIRLSGSSAMGEVQGVVVAYRGDRNALELRDLLSPSPMNFSLTAGTRVTRANQPASISELVPGTLVSVNFLPDPGNRPVAEQVTILITPGAEFRFSGRVTALDLHLGLLLVTSTDHRMYEIHFDPVSLPVSSDLREGAQVTVLIRYERNQYVAHGLTVDKGPAN